MPERLTLERALELFPKACQYALAEAGWSYYPVGAAWLHPIYRDRLMILNLGWAVIEALTKIWCERHLGSEVAYPISDIAPDPLRWGLKELELELKK